MPALHLMSSGVSLPKPGKTVGEDAFYISQHSVGVADGVGGWAKHGVDSGAYARSLMRGAREHAGSSRDPQQLLTHAYTTSQHIPGSSTACIVAIDRDNLLRGSVVGDCGYLVVRGDHTVYQSSPQMHDFNTPYQLGACCNTPHQSAHHEVAVQPGDLVVLASDGIFDNVTAHEIRHELRSGSTADMARRL